MTPPYLPGAGIELVDVPKDQRAIRVNKEHHLRPGPRPLLNNTRCFQIEAQHRHACLYIAQHTCEASEAAPG